MPFRAPAQEIVDAEVVSETPAPAVNRAPPSQNLTYLHPTSDQLGQTISMADLAKYEKQARAASVFLKIPLFTLIALNGKVPTLLRFGAAALGILEALQLARANHIGDQYLPPLEQ